MSEDQKLARKRGIRAGDNTFSLDVPAAASAELTNKVSALEKEVAELKVRWGGGCARRALASPHAHDATPLLLLTPAGARAREVVR